MSFFRNLSLQNIWQKCCICRTCPQYASNNLICFTCKKCNFKVNTEEALKNHLNLLIATIITYVLLVKCGTSRPTLKFIRKHMKADHSNHAIICTVCDEGLQNSVSFKVHLSNNTLEYYKMEKIILLANQVQIAAPTTRVSTTVIRYYYYLQTSWQCPPEIEFVMVARTLFM